MRKRTHIRGVIIPLAAKWAGVLLVAYLGAKITGFVTQARGIPNPLADGPFALYSLGWYLSQIAAVLVGVGAGALSSYFAPQGTWRAPAILIGLYLLFGFASVPASSGWVLGSYFALVGALSLSIGAFAFKWIESPRTRDVDSERNASTASI
ncbi:hypothetical protein [Acidovorax sp. HMWF029]|uniref:hypothetical protein n=1 Tax=Acidovorax sp. HMWF029 TaxID=2056863 RepID=UPI0011B230D5|nr:hypothetical protein [Acidovorax sp. HMWF029]